MPNWCTTLIELRGNTESIKKLLQNISSGTPGSDDYSAVDFNKIIPMPEYIYNGPIGPIEETVYGGKNCWYDWCCENWGTKWNCSHSMTGFCNDPDINTYVIHFNTAWCCPTILIGRMALLNKDIDFYVSWWEEDGRFDWFEITGPERRVTKAPHIDRDDVTFENMVEYVSFAIEDTEPFVQTYSNKL